MAAIEYFERSLRLSPLDLEVGVALSGLGVAFLMTGRTTDAYAPLRRAVEERPKWATGYRNLILACVRLGRLDEARTVGCRMLENIPDSRAGYTSPMSNQDYVTEQRQALRLAGLPE